MRARRLPATLLLLLLAIEALDANRRKQKDKISPEAFNICDISDRDSKIHCYCETRQEINSATKTECWVFNGGISKTDPFWSRFADQSNIETLAFNVRSDGGLNFVPTRVLRYLRKLKHYSIQHSSITEIESYSFSNITTLIEMTITKNKELQFINQHAFYNLPNLSVLTLDGNRIIEIASESFYALPSLQKLYLTSNNISVIHDRAFRHLVNLQELEIDKNNITELKKECFDGLANLNRLDLRRNKLSALHSFTFTELWNLQELLLDYNEIYSIAQRAFDGLSLLKKLSLSHNKLVSLVIGLFEGVRGLSALDLRHNKLQRFTYENLRPIYDNLKFLNSSLHLDGNDFDCDCHLAWMHKLRHEAKSVKVRTALEKFVCKFNGDPSLSSHFAYFERNSLASNNLFEIDEKSQDNLDEDIDDESYVEDTKLAKAANEKTLLQIPVEILPCPQEVKTVTDRTYTHPSQNEVKDFRNLIQTSSACGLEIHCVVVIVLIWNYLGYIVS